MPIYYLSNVLVCYKFWIVIRIGHDFALNLFLQASCPIEANLLTYKIYKQPVLEIDIKKLKVLAILALPVNGIFCLFKEQYLDLNKAGKTSIQS